MRRVVSALVIFGLLFTAGCDRNDKDVVNSIPKSHIAYPIFKLAFDNGYQMFGVDSALLTVTPGIGWLEDVYSNEYGQVPTQSAGTFVTDIDSTIDAIDSSSNPYDTAWAVDTSFVNFGFTPSATYSFSFSRPDPFVWIDSFQVDYLTSYDSVWGLLSAETLFVSTTPDGGIPPVVLVDSASLVTQFDTVGVDRPDSIYLQEVFKASWFDTTYVLSSASDTLALPPDSFFVDTLIWGFWNAIDSFFISFDSGDYCSKGIDSVYDTTFDLNNQVVSIDSTYNDFFLDKDSVRDINGFYAYHVDTVIHWINCQAEVNNTQMREYGVFGWGEFDTTRHITFPDTTKGLIFNPTGVDIYSWYILPDSSDTISDTTFSADILLITTVGTATDTTTLNDLTDIPLVMPSVEPYPDYRIIFIDN